MTFTFSTFAFASGSLELTREGRRVALEPQPARALAVLLARAGEVVTREEMRQAIWGDDTHVDYDRGLAYAVGQVRAALGDSAETPRFVQTLPKRGFCFIAPVKRDGGSVARSASPPVTPAPTEPTQPTEPTESKEPVRAAADTVTSARQGGRRRWLALAVAAAVLFAVAALLWPGPAPARRAVVAVSIFDNETGDATHDTFVTGLADVVVTELTSLAPGRIGVIGNAAPLRQPRNIRNLKTLAATVDADYVVLGQLQRQVPDLRFIVHFIRLSDGVHLSAQRFVRPAGEVTRFEQDVVGEAHRLMQRFIVDPQAPSSGAASR